MATRHRVRVKAANRTGNADRNAALEICRKSFSVCVVLVGYKSCVTLAFERVDKLFRVDLIQKVRIVVPSPHDPKGRAGVSRGQLPPFARVCVQGVRQEASRKSRTTAAQYKSQRVISLFQLKLVNTTITPAGLRPEFYPDRLVFGRKTIATGQEAT